ncbi:TetR/AcrR family transcriptional regulator [Caulobacter sp. KR2-114]|uniref:TetR/AcrR family transcriptional regulator n=1 Tax=Caulobacter sp. KR2-114 TaxID=3400912 RepID=UPI003C0ECC33
MTSKPTNANPMIGAWRLSTREGAGRYQTGRDRVAQILDVALEVILESGYQALTLREVARRCKIQIGAVTYYYRSRTDLLQDVLNMVLVPYAENLSKIQTAPGVTAEQKLEGIIRMLLEDIRTRQTTGLFPHLWALANHDPFVAKAVDSIYILERLRLSPLIGELNPRLGPQERETLAMFVVASVAGSTIFVGFEKPWTSELPLYTAIACRSLVELVKTVTPAQLESYGWRPRDRRSTWKPPTLLDADDYQALVAGSGIQTPA